MSHVRKFGPCVLAFLISLATFSGARAEGRRAFQAEALRDPSPPLARIWEWLLGWLPAGAPDPEPPAGGEAGGEDGDAGGLGPEMDPNGNPPTRIP